MIPLTEAETQSAVQLINLALHEDLEFEGDLTSEALIPRGVRGQALFVARSQGIISGLPIAALVFERGKIRGEDVVFQPLLEEGSRVSSGMPIARVRGCMHSILTCERVALNFLQRMSGVATLTQKYVDEVKGLPCHILDTRKTTPGFRMLEKYAVRCGGGYNHRMGLFDEVLIKDNHLATLARLNPPMTITEAIQLVRRKFGSTVPLEVEVDNLEQLDEALAVGPDVILLDNMEPNLLREAVRRRQEKASKVILEASGGITLSNLRAIAETGVDHISIGALTHSASALDIALDYQEH